MTNILTTYIPGNVAGLVLGLDGVITSLPGEEGVHLGLGRGLLHPLDSLPVGHDPHILTNHRSVFIIWTNQSGVSLSSLDHSQLT